MADKCAKALYKVAREALSEKEAQDLLQELRTRAQAKIDRNAQTKADAFQSTIDEVKAEMDKARRHAKRQSLLAMQAFSQIKERMDAGKDQIHGLGQYLDQIDTRHKSISKRHAQQMMNFLGKDNRLQLLQNKMYERDLARAMFNVNDARVKNSNLKEIGQLIKNQFENSRKVLNKLGANIGEIDGYIVRQSHDISKMMSPTGFVLRDIQIKAKLLKENNRDFKKVNEMLDDMAFNRWKNTILPKLDKEKTFNDLSPSEYSGFLKGAWEHLVSGISKQVPEDAPKTEQDLIKSFKNPSNLANRLGAQRVLHFKGSDQWLDYNNEYGKGRLYDAILSTMDANARNETMLRMMGPNPEAMWNKVYKMAAQEVRENPRSFTIRKRYNFLSSLWHWVSGEGDRVVDGMTAKIGSALRTQANLSNLGGVTFSAFPDLASKMVVMQSNGASFLDAYRGMLEGFQLDSGEKQKELAQVLETWAHSQVGHGAGRFFTIEKGKLVNQINNMYFHLNGLHWWDKSNQTGIQVALARLLGLNKDRSWNDLDVGLKSNLSRNGISENEWPLLQKSASTIYDNTHYMTANFVESLPDEDIQNYKKMIKSSQDVSNLRQEVADRLRDYFTDEAQLVSLPPTARDKALLLGKSQRGTVTGEIRHFLAQFKYFSLGYARRVMGRALFGQTANMGTRLAMMSNLLVSTTILGYLGWSARSLIEGKGIPDISEANSQQRWNILHESMIRGGTGGMYASFLLNAQPTLSSQISGALGPVFSMVNDAYRILYNTAYLHKNTGKAVSEFVRNNTPFHNWFALKYALDKTFFNAIMERTDPGALNREAARLREKYNQVPIF